MNTIKNIHRIQDLLSADVLQKLDAGAALHQRHAGITFKIVNVEPGVLTIQTTQSKNSSSVYQDKKTLITRTKELFAPAFPEHKIQVGAIPYAEPEPSVVTPQWLQKMMLKSSVTAKEISAQTGLDKTNISAWLNGHRPMSQIVKAMFYFYFKANFPETVES